MNDFDPFHKYVHAVVALLLLLLVGSPMRLTAQTAENLSGVKRVALDWPDTGKNSKAVRDRILQKLKDSSSVQVVEEAAQADAVLHGKAAIWETGSVYMSPRSRSIQQVSYNGYASMELSGKDGQVLWSYLVTPRKPGWKSIPDDLADQLTHQFLKALSAKGTAASTASGASSAEKSGGGSTLSLLGAGSTFAAPMYQKWFESFAHVRPELQIQYAAVGSEEGVRRVLGRKVDFGATDMPLPAEQLRSSNGRLLQIATMVGAVVPIYNVKGTSEGLRLTPEVMAGIFLGKIRQWDAPEIRAINKHAQLPHEAIEVIHRSDGSGTTFALTDYLSKVNQEWKSNLGAGTTVKWPVGRGAEGNEGVAAAVRDTPNSIGYVEYLYALQHQLEFAAVQSSSGEYVKADLDSITAAAKTQVASAKDEFSASITNAPGKHVYPIATLTWLLVPVEGADAAKTSALLDLLRWMLTRGQRECGGLGYAPLPPEFANRELQAMAAVR